MDFTFQLWHLLVRAFFSLPSRISGNWVAVVFGILVFSIRPIIAWRKDGWEKMKTESAKNIKDAFLLALISWTGLFLVSVAMEVYHNHNDETKRWRSVVVEKNTLKQILINRDSYIHDLELKLVMKPAAPAETKRPMISYEIEPSPTPNSPNQAMVLITATGDVERPAFEVTCETACSISNGQYLSGATKFEQMGDNPDKTKIQGRFVIPGVIKDGQQVILDIVSNDAKPVKVKYVKPLRYLHKRS